MSDPEAIDFPLAERPRLRAVEGIPTTHQGKHYLVLRDPGDPELEPLVISDNTVELVALLDGTRTLDEVHDLLAFKGETMPLEDIRSIVEKLDHEGFLEGARADHRQAERLRLFREQAVRPAVHAGGAYPNGLLDLPTYLAAGYLHAAGPGSLPSKRTDAPPLAGLIAPHVDLHRGAPTYSWGYKALAEAQPADLYLVLGTCHTGVQGAFAGTTKAYETPLGAVPADQSFLERVQKLWGHDLFEGEFGHATEHSIEFQAVYLRSLGLAGENAAPMAPIMCDSLHSLVMEPYSPRDVALVSDFVDALREAIVSDGRRITVIAAVDLAHIGQRFGDPWLVDAERQKKTEAADREMLALVADADAEGYFRQVMRDRDARRICGFTPIYLLTELMAADNRKGELLRYKQWVASDQSSSVTFTSMVFR